jgi:hypothetical protein
VSAICASAHDTGYKTSFKRIRRRDRCGGNAAAPWRYSPVTFLLSITDLSPELAAN